MAFFSARVKGTISVISLSRKIEKAISALRWFHYQSCCSFVKTQQGRQASSLVEKGNEVL
jgi:hypothetical protein